MIQLIRRPVFAVGLALRLALFVAMAALQVTPDAAGRLAGGAAAGLYDAIAFLPGALLAVVGLPAAGLFLCVVGWEIVTYVLLARFGASERRHEVLALFWLSPLAIVAAYLVGAEGVVPAAALVGAFIACDRRKHLAAGALFGVALALLPPLLTLVPVLVLYAARLGRVRPGTKPFLVGLAAAVAIGIGSQAAVAAATGAPFLPELAPLLALAIPSGGAASIALLPLVFAALLYMAWRVRILDERLLAAFVAASLVATVSVGGLSPAVAIAALPFLAHHAAYAETSGRALVTTFAVLLVAWFLAFDPGAPVSLATAAAAALGSHAAGARNLLATAAVCVGLVVLVQIVQRGVLRSPALLAQRRTVAIGIAGDSGVGKDTVAAGLVGLFSPRMTAQVSGDDYHLWDRNRPMWRALTHLNPMANDLATFTQHVVSLVDRRWVRARHYDHATGRMTKPFVIQPGEIVVAVGLHALFSAQLNRLYDLRVYLDMDEGLRRFLKIRRDVEERGHPRENVLRSIERRYTDAVAFVHPQREAAHLVFALQPRVPARLAAARSIDDVPLRLVVNAQPGFDLESVARDLVALCGIQAVLLARPTGASELSVCGDPTARDIATVAGRIAPEVCRLVRADAGWESGLKGVMQLVLISQLEQVLRRRSVNA